MLVSHTFVADKMDKDRPGPPALDDNMEEEVPSTSVVQERCIWWLRKCHQSLSTGAPWCRRIGSNYAV